MIAKEVAARKKNARKLPNNSLALPSRVEDVRPVYTCWCVLVNGASFSCQRKLHRPARLSAPKTSRSFLVSQDQLLNN